MFVKICLVLICIPLGFFVIISYALVGPDVGVSLTWLENLVGAFCSMGFSAVGFYVVLRLWPGLEEALTPVPTCQLGRQGGDYVAASRPTVS